jgi:hypothetical protein
LMSVDNGFCWTSGDWVEVRIGVGTHFDSALSGAVFRNCDSDDGRYRQDVR